jgi:hypothetical protein
MSAKEHLIMTILVLVLVLVFISAGGCSQIVHSSDPGFEYPKTAKEALRL